MSERTERVGDMMRAELSAIFLREMKDPRVRLATVSEVRVTRDLAHATVLVSVLGSDEDRDATIGVLKRAAGFLRSALAKHTRLRTTPELHFELDRGPEYSQRMEEILHGLQQDGQLGSDAPADGDAEAGETDGEPDGGETGAR